jgi:hypothetical protein
LRVLHDLQPLPREFQCVQVESTVQASVTPMEQFFVRTEAEISAQLHNSMLIREYRIRDRKFKFYERLAEKHADDPTFRSPISHARSLSLTQQRKYKAPVKPAAYASMKRRKAKEHESEGTTVRNVGGREVHSSRLAAIWHHSFYDAPDLEYLISDPSGPTDPL